MDTMHDSKLNNTKPYQPMRRSPPSRGKSLRHSIVKLVSGESKSNWGRLQDIEKKRRALLKRTDESAHKILFSVQGTFWKIVIRTPLVWVTVAIFVLVRLASLWDHMSLPPVETSHVGVVGGLITFFLVFFHIQYSNRFDKLYLDSTALQGRIFDMSLLARSTLPTDRAMRLIRYLNAAHIAGYVGLSPKVYSMDDCFFHLNKKYQLLTDAEFCRLREIGMGEGCGSAIHREALAWCAVEVQDALRAGIIGEYTSVLFHEKIMSMRGSFANMFDLDDQPILFFYIHFIHFLSAVYLPLLAFVVAHQVTSYQHWMSDVVGLAAVVLQGIFIVGIRVLAQIMQHPYGDELENLSVLTYIDVAYFGSIRLLNSQARDPLNPSVEEELARGREAMGHAWEDPLDDDSGHTSVSTETRPDEEVGSCFVGDCVFNDEELGTPISNGVRFVDEEVSSRVGDGIFIDDLGKSGRSMSSRTTYDEEATVGDASYYA